MKIAILGTGAVGQAFAERLTGLGHEVMMGTRNVLDKKRDGKFSDYLSKHTSIKLANLSEATSFGNIVLNVLKGSIVLEALEGIGKEILSEKILVDISNPLDFSKGIPPNLIPELSNTNSLGEEIQKRFPNTKVIKTLNTMWNGIMINPDLIGSGDHVNYICGNDAEAKNKVFSFLNEIGWKNESILDLGDITAARATEATLPIWLRVYGATQNGAFNFKIVK
jgi:8-hydroxy-5-deazaflavin:NADPH oxidoreductase